MGHQNVLISHLCFQVSMKNKSDGQPKLQVSKRCGSVIPYLFDCLIYFAVVIVAHSLTIEKSGWMEYEGCKCKSVHELS